MSNLFAKDHSSALRMSRACMPRAIDDTVQFNYVKMQRYDCCTIRQFVSLNYHVCRVHSMGYNAISIAALLHRALDEVISLI